jgi:hypothetical protein
LVVAATYLRFADSVPAKTGIIAQARCERGRAGEVSSAWRVGAAKRDLLGQVVLDVLLDDIGSFGGGIVAVLAGAAS